MCTNPSVPGKHFDKCAEIHDLPNGAHIDLADFDFLGQPLDHIVRLLRRRLVGGRDRDIAGVFDIDLHAGLPAMMLRMIFPPGPMSHGSYLA